MRRKGVLWPLVGGAILGTNTPGVYTIHIQLICLSHNRRNLSAGFRIP